MLKTEAKGTEPIMNYRGGEQQVKVNFSHSQFGERSQSNANKRRSYSFEEELSPRSILKRKSYRSYIQECTLKGLAVSSNQINFLSK